MMIIYNIYEVMILENRKNLILDKIHDSKNANVKELSELFSVSESTIRQDLRHLEGLGLLKRDHGGIAHQSDDNMMKRLAIRYQIKSRIAKEATSLVSDNETVLIESGSTNAIFAKLLGKKKNINVITNSAFIARYTKDENIRVILLGGDYQPESEVCVGPLVKKALEGFFVDKAFIGIDGFTIDSGFTSSDHIRSEATRAIAASAKKVFVMTDSTKFGKRGISTLFDVKDVYGIVTDNDIDYTNKKYLLENNIQLITV